MHTSYQALLGAHTNLVLLGEAGCGKSELALNFAAQLAGGPRPVHVFDLDQTKPIYRSRDARGAMEKLGVALHHEQHDFDSPTIVGGVAECLQDPGRHAILDIGGGEAGARMIGRFAHQLNRENTIVYYAVNPYRPWSRETMAIDCTLSAILRVSRIQSVHILSNPSLGAGTTAEEFLQGLRQTKALLGGAMPVEGACVRQELYETVREEAGLPVLPLRLYLKYEWLDEIDE